MGSCHTICYSKRQKSQELPNDIVLILQNSEESKDDQEIPQQPENASQEPPIVHPDKLQETIAPKTMKDKFLQGQQKSIITIQSVPGHKEDSDQEKQEIHTTKLKKKNPDSQRVQSSDLLSIQNSEIEIHQQELQKSSFCFEQIILDKKKEKNSEESKSTSGYGRFSTKDGTMNYEGF